jgi:hypothetical protein
VLLKSIEPGTREGIHGLDAVSDVREVLIAGCGDEVMTLAAVDVPWAVNGPLRLLTPGESEPSFFVRKSAPPIHGEG